MKMPGELKTFLQDTLGDSYCLEPLLSKLEELGVETSEDLKYIEVADLSNVLKPVQCRKFVQAVAAQHQTNSGM